MGGYQAGFTRRGMLGTAAAALAAPAFAARRLGPSDRVNVAIIGAGGQGCANMTKLVGENIVASCDVDYDHVWRGMLDKHFQMIPARQPVKDAYDKAPRFSDYRKMFDAQKDIDAVVIATPDHHHAVAARMAMERGIHVYVQKPLTYTVEEGRRLLAKLRGRVTGLAWPTYVLDIPGGHGRCRLDLTIWRLTTGCATRLACSVRVRRRRTRRRRRSRPEPGRCRSPAFAARQARCAHSPSTLHPGG